MTAPLHDRHAFVTGASRGIGAAIARKLVEHGARVTLIGRHRAALEQIADELGARARIAVADVTDREQVEAAVRAAGNDIDILINNAGQAATASFLRTDEALWRSMLDVNLDGAYFATQAVLPGMVERGFGRIVNIASTAGLTGYAYCTAYCAAKHALIGLTRALAREVAGRAITVNAVCPGFTDTDLVRDAVTKIREKTGRSASEALATLVAHNPHGRLIRPEEVAHTVLWLCLPDSASITGQSIAIAGGEVV